MFRQLFEFAQHLLRFRSISRNGMRVAEESLVPCAGNHNLTALKFRDCSRGVAFPEEAAAQQMTSHRRSWIELQRLSDLDNCIVISTRVIQVVGERGLKERIQRIEFDRFPV